MGTQADVPPGLLSQVSCIVPRAVTSLAREPVGRTYIVAREGWSAS